VSASRAEPLIRATEEKEYEKKMITFAGTHIRIGR
jgi:hypothetical protein